MYKTYTSMGVQEINGVKMIVPDPAQTKVFKHYRSNGIRCFKNYTTRGFKCYSKTKTLRVLNKKPNYG